MVVRKHERRKEREVGEHTGPEFGENAAGNSFTHFPAGNPAIHSIIACLLIMAGRLTPFKALCMVKF